MLNFDFDGIEAVYPINTKTQTAFLKAKAKEFNKLITAGSDFHGITTADVSHGDIGSVSLSNNELDTFIKALDL